MIEGKGDDESEDDTQVGFFTSCGTLSAQTAAKTIETLLNQAYLHQLSPDTTPKAGLDDRAVDSFASEALSRYDSSQFYGIVIDTGAAKRSTAGIS